METQVVRRRLNKITSHFAAASSEDKLTTHLLPMNCSSSLNYVMPRYDNRMHFGRQGSASQASFMRQVSTDQQRTSLDKSSASLEPIFSRPAKVEPNSSNPEPTQHPIKDFRPPNFARPNRLPTKKERCNCTRKVHNSTNNGIEWSPRMDVVESGRNYLVMVEIPGVDVNDIRVEISDQKLKVMGKRSSSCQNDSLSTTYHKKEILQGPYLVEWQLPPNVNKDSVSAEFLRNGFLQIIVPKLRNIKTMERQEYAK